MTAKVTGGVLCGYPPEEALPTGRDGAGKDSDS